MTATNNTLAEALEPFFTMADAILSEWPQGCVAVDLWVDSTGKKHRFGAEQFRALATLRASTDAAATREGAAYRVKYALDHCVQVLEGLERAKPGHWWAWIIKRAIEASKEIDGLSSQPADAAAVGSVTVKIGPCQHRWAHAPTVGYYRCIDCGGRHDHSTPPYKQQIQQITHPPADAAIREAEEIALKEWLALPDQERSAERPWIMGFNAGWEAALSHPAPAEPVGLREAITQVMVRCEALEDEAHEGLARENNEHATGFYRGQKSVAKSIRRELHDLTLSTLTRTDEAQS